MRPEDKPKLSNSTKNDGCRRTTINDVGKDSFELQLGSANLPIEAIIAEIDDDGLLWVDVLQNGQNGLTDLLLNKGVLRVDDKEVRLLSPRTTKLWRGYMVCPVRLYVCSYVHLLSSL